MIPFKKEVEALHLPFGKYALFGSVVLAVRGIREAKDVDIVVKKDLWEDLVKQYPEHLSLDGASIQLGNVELFRDWRSLTPEIDAMVDTAEVFDGIPVVHPEYLIRFKMELGRPKDMIDRELLQKYLQKQS